VEEGYAGESVPLPGLEAHAYTDGASTGVAVEKIRSTGFATAQRPGQYRHPVQRFTARICCSA
jgi:hypothetical protein